MIFKLCLLTTHTFFFFKVEQWQELAVVTNNISTSSSKQELAFGGGFGPVYKVLPNIFFHVYIYLVLA